MEPLFVVKVILTVLFVAVSVVLSAIVLLQEGKSAGLTGAISGAAESYWGKNRGRSMEGRLEKTTKYLAIAFFILAIVLNLGVFPAI
ncbi:MAG: preprotein translocase subunit SecG [Lachnospiraceae bacterium]|nr:preprotein translocase subunit SecG [Lachnospiraceae bacterium]